MSEIADRSGIILCRKFVSILVLVVILHYVG